MREDIEKTGPKAKNQPPGRIKIIKAFKSLLLEKDFNSITWAEIARTAGVNEGLIYKYFKDSLFCIYPVACKYHLQGL